MASGYHGEPLKLVGDYHRLKGLVASFNKDDFTRARSLRIAALRSAMEENEVDALVLSLGADLPWLVGYEPMPLERITALVLSRESEVAYLVVPKLEAPRVPPMSDEVVLTPWDDTQNPFVIIAGLLSSPAIIGVSERGWASWLLSLQNETGDARYIDASQILGRLRGKKDMLEISLLALASAGADQVAAMIANGEIPLRSRTEKEVAKDISRALFEWGHSRVNFAIVGSDTNSASPHHEPTDRKIGANEPVVCDFGGSLSVMDEPGYCSDITRTFYVGEPPGEFSALYGVLFEAQALGREAVGGGVSLAHIDQVARGHIEAAGYGEYFIHRLGHGIGLQEHEGPYLSPMSDGQLEVGNVFSVEPGIYLPNRFGARIEDIVVCTEDGPVELNRFDRELVIVGMS